MRRLLALLALICGALVLTAGAADAQEQARLGGRSGSPEEAERLLSVLAPIADFGVVQVAPDGYTFGLRDSAGHHVGDLHVGFTDRGGDLPRVRSRSFTMKIWNTGPDFSEVPALVRGAEAIAAHDGGALPQPAIRMNDVETSEMVLATVFVVVAGLAAALLRGGRITRDIRKAHVIQACVHTSIFVYWSVYWPGVGNQLPMILLMIVMAYGADAAFSFARFGSWRLGLSPLPVVFSTNLFVWLDWRGAVIAVIGAFACKTYVQRGGRHVFNPSVAGLTLNALCTVLFPGLVHFGGLFHTLNVPPNMAEWVFLASLIPLTIFRLLPVSIGAVLGLLYLTDTPGALRPTLLLMMTLLCTDPATTPRSDLGRLLFGVMVGASYPVYSHLLRSIGQPDDFAKILSVPLANLLVPQLDAVAARLVQIAGERRASAWTWLAPRLGALARRLEAVGARLVPVPNGVFVVTWALLFVLPLRSEKLLDFEPSLHWNWGTPLVVRDADGVPRCASNPVFCKPFSFAGEARLWLGL